VSSSHFVEILFCALRNAALKNVLAQNMLVKNTGAKSGVSFRVDLALRIMNAASETEAHCNAARQHH
jgi:hypothetical protein